MKYLIISVLLFAVNVVAYAKTDLFLNDLKGNVKILEKYVIGNSGKNILIEKFIFNEKGMYRSITKYNRLTGNKTQITSFKYNANGELVNIIRRNNKKKQIWEVEYESINEGIEQHRTLKYSNGLIKKRYILKFDANGILYEKLRYRNEGKELYKRTVLNYNKKGLRSLKEVNYYGESKKSNVLIKSHYNYQARRVKVEVWYFSTSARVSAAMNEPDIIAFPEEFDGHDNITRLVWKTKLDVGVKDYRSVEMEMFHIEYFQ